MGDVTTTFQQKFLNNLEMALQQEKDVLEEVGAIEVQSEAGVELVKVKDILGTKMGQEVDTRFADTVWNPSPFEAVWLAKPNEIVDAEMVDNADRLATMIDLGGAAVMNGAAIIRRARLQRALEGFYGPIVSGKKATVSTAFPAGNVIDAAVGGAAATKMNTAKIRAANKLLRQNYVPMGLPKFMILTADDNDALLTEVPATSSDFKASYGGVVDGDGNLRSLLGWRFIHLELDDPLLDTIPALATDGSSQRLTPFWVKGGLVRNDWQNVRTEVGKIPQKNFNLGYLSGTTCAATRTQAGMCGQIENVKG